ncbi:hypothetical protein D8Y22_16465 [Salinadaptatus halalkaliphilus]|uniref:Uncharacterized protein n=1 Tax=Salinadaptatus halalkaliphilus TaxID=2419781 RepID=A0A4S3TIX5_9EURY|nr:hypothetical protein D8Y22_16465 [Salinadaptatus halalkaliphilus]
MNQVSPHSPFEQLSERLEAETARCSRRTPPTHPTRRSRRPRANFGTSSPNSRTCNPTAVSLVPHGPLPASASTRISTVPQNVHGAAVDALPRIYGRRWKTNDGSR